LAFVVVEIVAGLWSNSLALLTDAAHNFTDVIALGLSWYAIRIATRPGSCPQNLRLSSRRHFGRAFQRRQPGADLRWASSTKPGSASRPRPKSTPAS
jgi:hypothetical protein